eukprot:TRINITY_DN2794_c0_g1_i1.p1 TRINITY_DN2794_c0_g1~~TRINITY_DN2794_c0_g1_i1.p1  ORF type:complete len:488 (+),score=92.50 TRINITY_DN2794_c0_g1_i1:932-2395(+)
MPFSGHYRRRFKIIPWPCCGLVQPCCSHVLIDTLPLSSTKLKTSGLRTGARPAPILAKAKVSYFYDNDVGNYYYGGHVMKPQRIKMTHNLILAYGLYKHLDVFRPHPATEEDMTAFHLDEYVQFLRTVSPGPEGGGQPRKPRFNVGCEGECPVFDGLWEFCQISAGGSLGAAARLNRRQCDVAVNWAGGLHHAKRAEASGFCYINDAVLGILELLKHHQRVLYVDIDVHHGDGVEEAFYTTDRVMTVSFHKYDGCFFPGTGHILDNGAKRGKYYAVNCPLKDGMDDWSYECVFRPIIRAVMENYAPQAVVLQCGADSLTGDRLGSFNLSLRGHGACVTYIRSFGLPTLVLGGGGYTIRNVARCWTYETSLLVNQDLPDTLPIHDYLDYYQPDYKLHIPIASQDNANDAAFLERNVQTILQHLREIRGPPGIQLVDVPDDALDLDEDSDQDNPDERVPQRVADRSVQHPSEFYVDDMDHDKVTTLAAL